MNTLKSYFYSLKNINPDILKLIALITMTMDHIGHVFFPGEFMVLRFFGRFSFPIFIFLLTSHLAEKDIYKKYILRLLPFAFLSLIIVTPFDIYIKETFKLTILWSLLLYTLTLFCFEKISNENTPSFIKGFCYFLTLSVGLTLSLIVDYGYFGYLFAITLYGYFKTNKNIYLYFTLLFSFLLNSKGFFIYPTLILIMCTTSFLVTLFLLQQKRPPNKNHRRFLKPWWVFYTYFPVHFFVLYITYIFLNS
ncbi:MAG: hypothetical protein IJY92_02550 [Alphaproteobacteria bacterium]|nr:hypothetical protein [Alphaproteobacteria bacterium]